MAPPYRLLVVDVDGTLLSPEGRTTPATSDAIRAADAAGVLVTLATGRRFLSAQPIAASLGVRVPIILHNGALVKDSATGEVLFDCHLPADLARQAIAIVLRHRLQPIVYENAYGGETLVAGPADLDSAAGSVYLSRNSERLRRVPDPGSAITADPLEIFVLDTAPRVEALYSDLARDDWRTIISVSVIRSDSRFLEVLNRDCSKARAVQLLAEQLGVSMAEVAAIGDNYNDLDMIEAAGLGIAMGQAPEAVKAVAGAVVGSNAQDGVAEAIYRYVLGDRVSG